MKKQFTGKRVSVSLTPALESAVASVARDLGGSEAQAARRLMEAGAERVRPSAVGAIPRVTAKRLFDENDLRELLEREARKSLYLTPAQNKVLLRRIQDQSQVDLPPTLDFTRLVAYAKDASSMRHKWDAARAWAVYVSFDPNAGKAGRYSVLAIHRERGVFRVIGRELSLDHAMRIAKGEE